MFCARQVALIVLLLMMFAAPQVSGKPICEDSSTSETLCNRYIGDCKKGGLIGSILKTLCHWTCKWCNSCRRGKCATKESINSVAVDGEVPEGSSLTQTCPNREKFTAQCQYGKWRTNKLIGSCSQNACDEIEINPFAKFVAYTYDAAPVIGKVPECTTAKRTCALGSVMLYYSYATHTKWPIPRSAGAKSQCIKGKWQSDVPEHNFICWDGCPQLRTGHGSWSYTDFNRTSYPIEDMPHAMLPELSKATLTCNKETNPVDENGKIVKNPPAIKCECKIKSFTMQWSAIYIKTWCGKEPYKFEGYWESYTKPINNSMPPGTAMTPVCPQRYKKLDYLSHSNGKPVREMATVRCKNGEWTPKTDYHCFTACSETRSSPPHPEKGQFIDGQYMMGAKWTASYSEKEFPDWTPHMGSWTIDCGKQVVLDLTGRSNIFFQNKAVMSCINGQWNMSNGLHACSIIAHDECKDADYCKNSKGDCAWIHRYCQIKCNRCPITTFFNKFDWKKMPKEKIWYSVAKGAAVDYATAERICMSAGSMLANLKINDPNSSKMKFIRDNVMTEDYHHVIGFIDFLNAKNCTAISRKGVTDAQDCSRKLLPICAMFWTAPLVVSSSAVTLRVKSDNDWCPVEKPYELSNGGKWVTSGTYSDQYIPMLHPLPLVKTCVKRRVDDYCPPKIYAPKPKPTQKTVAKPSSPSPPSFVLMPTCGSPSPENPLPHLKESKTYGQLLDKTQFHICRNGKYVKPKIKYECHSGCPILSVSGGRVSVRSPNPEFATWLPHAAMVDIDCGAKDVLNADGKKNKYAKHKFTNFCFDGKWVLDMHCGNASDTGGCQTNVGYRFYYDKPVMSGKFISDTHAATNCFNPKEPEEKHLWYTAVYKGNNRWHKLSAGDTVLTCKNSKWIPENNIKATCLKGCDRITPDRSGVWIDEFSDEYPDIVPHAATARLECSFGFDLLDEVYVVHKGKAQAQCFMGKWNIEYTCRKLDYKARKLCEGLPSKDSNVVRSFYIYPSCFVATKSIGNFEPAKKLCEGFNHLDSTWKTRRLVEFTTRKSVEDFIEKIGAVWNQETEYWIGLVKNKYDSWEWLYADHFDGEAVQFWSAEDSRYKQRCARFNYKRGRELGKGFQPVSCEMLSTKSYLTVKEQRVVDKKAEEKRRRAVERAKQDEEAFQRSLNSPYALGGGGGAYVGRRKKRYIFGGPRISPAFWEQLDDRKEYQNEYFRMPSWRPDESLPKPHSPFPALCHFQPSEPPPVLTTTDVDDDRSKCERLPERSMYIWNSCLVFREHKWPWVRNRLANQTEVRRAKEIEELRKDPIGRSMLREFGTNFPSPIPELCASYEGLPDWQIVSLPTAVHIQEFRDSVLPTLGAVPENGIRKVLTGLFRLHMDDGWHWTYKGATVPADPKTIKWDGHMGHSSRCAIYMHETGKFMAQSECLAESLKNQPTICQYDFSPEEKPPQPPSFKQQCADLGRYMPTLYRWHSCLVVENEPINSLYGRDCRKLPRGQLIELDWYKATYTFSDVYKQLNKSNATDDIGWLTIGLYKDGGRGDWKWHGHSGNNDTVVPQDFLNKRVSNHYRKDSYAIKCAQIRGNTIKLVPCHEKTRGLCQYHDADVQYPILSEWFERECNARSDTTFMWGNCIQLKHSKFKHWEDFEKQCTVFPHGHLIVTPDFATSSELYYSVLPRLGITYGHNWRLLVGLFLDDDGYWQWLLAGNATHIPWIREPRAGERCAVYSFDDAGFIPRGCSEVDPEMSALCQYEPMQYPKCVVYKYGIEETDVKGPTCAHYGSQACTAQTSGGSIARDKVTGDVIFGAWRLKSHKYPILTWNSNVNTGERKVCYEPRTCMSGGKGKKAPWCWVGPPTKGWRSWAYCFQDCAQVDTHTEAELKIAIENELRRKAEEEKKDPDKAASKSKVQDVLSCGASTANCALQMVPGFGQVYAAIDFACSLIFGKNPVQLWLDFIQNPIEAIKDMFNNIKEKLIWLGKVVKKILDGIKKILGGLFQGFKFVSGLPGIGKRRKREIAGAAQVEPALGIGGKFKKKKPILMVMVAGMDCFNALRDSGNEKKRNKCFKSGAKVLVANAIKRIEANADGLKKMVQGFKNPFKFVSDTVKSAQKIIVKGFQNTFKVGKSAVSTGTKVGKAMASTVSAGSGTIASKVPFACFAFAANDCFKIANGKSALDTVVDAAGKRRKRSAKQIPNILIIAANTSAAVSNLIENMPSTSEKFEETVSLGIGCMEAAMEECFSKNLTLEDSKMESCFEEQFKIQSSINQIVVKTYEKDETVQKGLAVVEEYEKEMEPLEEIADKMNLEDPFDAVEQNINRVMNELQHVFVNVTILVENSFGALVFVHPLFDGHSLSKKIHVANFKDPFAHCYLGMVLHNASSDIVSIQQVIVNRNHEGYIQLIDEMEETTSYLFGYDCTKPAQAPPGMDKNTTTDDKDDFDIDLFDVDLEDPEINFIVDEELDSHDKDDSKSELKLDGSVDEEVEIDAEENQDLDVLIDNNVAVDESGNDGASVQNEENENAMDPQNDLDEHNQTEETNAVIAGDGSKLVGDGNLSEEVGMQKEETTGGDDQDMVMENDVLDELVNMDTQKEESEQPMMDQQDEINEQIQTEQLEETDRAIDHESNSVEQDTENAEDEGNNNRHVELDESENQILDEDQDSNEQQPMETLVQANESQEEGDAEPNNGVVDEFMEDPE